jgi:hypothetical protein
MLSVARYSHLFSSLSISTIWHQLMGLSHNKEKWLGIFAQGLQKIGLCKHRLTLNYSVTLNSVLFPILQ